MISKKVLKLAIFGLIFSLGIQVTTTAYAIGQDGSLKKGASGLPLPRFVSLKADKVNVRKGPGKDFKVTWVYRKAGLPVEVVAESDNWRRVRDSEGNEGWVFHRLLSGRRTATVMPWAKKQENGRRPKIPFYRTTAASQNNISLYVEAGILGDVISCDNKWCKLSISDHQGWIEQERLWGVYQNEKLD